MIVVMAVHTVGVQPEIGGSTLTQGIIDDEFRGMTLATFLFLMSSFELVTGQVMVEGIFIKPNDLEVTPMMITVAAETILANHFRRNMVSALSIQTVLDLHMTIQTFLIGDLLSNDVTLGTIGQTFQVGMRLGQLAR